MAGRLSKVFGESMEESFKYEEGTKSVFDFDFSQCRNAFTCKNLIHAALGGQISEENHEIGKMLDSAIRMCHEGISTLHLSLRIPQEDSFSPCSIITLSKISEDDQLGKFHNDVFVNIIGWSFHPLKLVFNTSCHPNLDVTNFCEQGVSAWIVKYPVKAGEQLFLCYVAGNEWFLKSKSERQKIWTKNYGFKCDCEACVSKWNVKRLPGYQKIDSLIPKNMPKREEAEKVFEENCKYINENYSKEYPSGEFEHF